MPVNLWTRCNRVSARRIAAVTLLCGTGALAGAQERTPPKVELFGGYSYLYPNATVNGTVAGALLPLSSCLCAIPRGAGGSVTYDFNSWLGLTADVSGHWGSNASNLSDALSRASFFNASLGPKLTYRSHHFSPFAEALVGAHRLSPQIFSPDTKIGFMAGGGVDWNLGRHFALRVVQADFVYSDHHFGTVASVADTDMRGVRLQAGVVFMFGGHPLAAAMAAPIHEPSIAAHTVPPAIAPPSITCSANPSTMFSGESATVTAVSTSSQPLRYSYNTAAGVITGSTSTAILSAAGVAPGTVLVTCTVTDDIGQSASQTTSVVVLGTPVQPAITTSALCSISFARDMRRAARVDNEAKACLDDVALNLQRNPDAKLVLVGDAGSSEPGRDHVAAQRTANTKAYLVSDKGIDPSRVTLYTGSKDEKAVSIILVPAGATIPAAGYTLVDESKVTVQPRSSPRVSSLQRR